MFLTDGTLNIAILKFGDDQLGKGLDYTGIHHFGVVVDDVETRFRYSQATSAADACIHHCNDARRIRS